MRYLFPLAITLMTILPAAAVDLDVWIGTQTSNRKGPFESEGIYHATFNIETGKLGPTKLATKLKSCGFVTLHPTLPILYTVGDTNDGPGVLAFKISADSKLEPFADHGSLLTGNGGACHIATDRKGKFLFTAQYGSGSVSMYRLGDDGRLVERTCTLTHEGGSNIVPRRQQTPHAHWIGPDLTNRFVTSPDLGLDAIVVYALDADEGQLKPHGKVEMAAGAGPRHMKYHPNGKWAYVVNELDCTVTPLQYDADSGSFTAGQSVSTVPDDLDVDFNSCAEIRIHPQGKFVYASNRGHDSIAVFSIDQESGAIKTVEREPIRGSLPRNFNLDPSGKWLIAAGGNSNTLTVFRVDQNTGKLSYTGQSVAVPAPICVTLGQSRSIVPN